MTTIPATMEESVNRLFEILEQLQKHHVPYFADSGFLVSLLTGKLGPLGCRKFDIAMRAEDVALLRRSFLSLRLNGWRVTKTRMRKETRGIRKGDISRISIRRSDGWRRDKDFRLVISVQYLEGDRRYWNAHDRTFACTETLVQPGRVVPFHGREIPVPVAAEEYLDFCFNNWKSGEDRLDWWRFARNCVESTATALTPENLAAVRRILFGAVDLLDRFEIPYYLEGGTLLGIVRDGDLLPWDYDADIAISAKDLPRLQRILPLFWLKGWRVSPRRFPKATDAWQEGAVRTYKIKSWGSKFGGDKICLDIFIKYEHDGFSYWQANERVMRIDSRFYSSHEFVEYKGKRLRAPADYEKYLETKYGNWRIPVRDWDCARDERTVVGSAV